jgi:propanediol dehydratase large subunit
MIDLFIARYHIDPAVATEAMAIPSPEIARMLVDMNVPRSELVRIAHGLTPAKLAEVVAELNALEIAFAYSKMRARKTPGNQAHVTNAKDDPLQLAADAAIAVALGFDEIETTMRVSRNAWANAVACCVGASVGRAGTLFQCSSEEAEELAIGMAGFTSYAETVSVYGTERAFIDGDDTPWSKAFLASAYASRGIKMRFTSGTGSEVQMGNAEGRSMLYLEIRCILMAKGAGVQGLQNGSISCIGVPGAVPGGIRAVAAENLVASWMDLECASGNDQSFSHSAMRRTSRLLPQMLPGTDFVCSGYSAVPNKDNMFAGSNLDTDDYDDWNVIQRDMQVDGGLRHVREDVILQVRNKAARAMQALFAELDLPPITDEEIEAATYANSSDDYPDRDVLADLEGARSVMERGITGIDLVRFLERAGFGDVAENYLQVLRQRVSGDLLQTAAVLTGDFTPLAAINDANDYAGPGTGYRLTGERWEELKKLRHVTSAENPEEEVV